MTATDGQVQPPTLASAVDALWRAIRRRHKRLPRAVVTIVPGNQPRCAGSVLCPDGTARVTVATGTIAASRDAVLRVMLHQGAHLLAGEPADGNFRYHSVGFRDAASALGLSTGDRRADIGWQETGLAQSTASRYEAQLAEVAASAQAANIPDREPFSRNGLVVQCQCSNPVRRFRIRDTRILNQLEAEGKGIGCEVCGGRFTAVST